MIPEVHVENETYYDTEELTNLIHDVLKHYETHFLKKPSCRWNAGRSWFKHQADGTPHKVCFLVGYNNQEVPTHKVIRPPGPQMGAEILHRLNLPRKTKIYKDEFEGLAYQIETPVVLSPWAVRNIIESVLSVLRLRMHEEFKELTFLEKITQITVHASVSNEAKRKALVVKTKSQIAATENNIHWDLRYLAECEEKIKTLNNKIDANRKLLAKRQEKLRKLQGGE